MKGLAETDRHTTGLFGRAFIETSPDQQAEILSWLGEKMTAELDAQRSLPHQSRRSRQVVSEIFYFMLRHLTLTAYYTSEAGASAELHFQVIPDSHEGCAAVPIDKEGT